MIPEAQEILDKLQAADIQFLRLQFCDVLGNLKSVEVPRGQFEKAISGSVMFDGTAVQGFERLEESDMLLRPDLSSFTVYPPFGADESGSVARLVCDVHLPSGEPFAGDPRFVLRRQIARAAERGFTLFAGLEPEFFLFEAEEAGGTLRTVDRAGYFDLAPLDKGERLRRDISTKLLEMGFEIEASHHEVAPGQHEIDFRYQEALATADALSTFKFVVKRIALERGMRASFLPKPLAGVHGSGLHTHLSLFKKGENAFYDPRGSEALSEVALHFIGGLLEHASAICAITNPLVNSYKRLVPGFEAPINAAWSTSQRSALLRVPAKRGGSTRAEFRLPDPSCNPYLALSVMLAAGLDGIERRLEPPPAIGRNIYQMTVREKRHHRVRDLPRDLFEALSELERDEALCAALGEHVLKFYLSAKRAEWQAYAAAVHPWELAQDMELG